VVKRTGSRRPQSGGANSKAVLGETTIGGSCKGLFQGKGGPSLGTVESGGGRAVSRSGEKEGFSGMSGRV